MTVATTMNVRVVAYMKPAAQAWVHPIARAYSAAGTPRTTSIATRNTRHENDRPGTGGQCGYVQAGAGAHDEHRDQEPEADRFELDLELGRCTTISVSSERPRSSTPDWLCLIEPSRFLVRLPRPLLRA
jgi:hypothetical protein